MKDFWKIVAGSALGVFLLSIALSILCTIMTVAMIASASALSSSSAYVAPDSVLDIDMSRLQIGEQTLEENPFSSLAAGMGGITAQEEIRTVGILDAVEALEAAASDPCIKLAYIRPDMASDISHLEEFRAALAHFRESGKPVIAFIDTPTNAGYYLASVADRIYMSEYHGGMNLMVGLSGRMIFLKDLLDKLGINIQLIRHGKYKSAGEMFIKNSASPENLEQNTVMIKSIWKEMVAPMASRAGMTPEQFNALIDDLELVDAQSFLEKGLVDELVSYEGMKQKLCVHSGAGKYSSIHSISLADYVSLVEETTTKVKDRIAIIYADGNIIDGREKENVAGKRFADIIDQVRADSKVKAVVLRVNSPGGSVIASSQIKDAVDALRKEKPVVASYGSYAASGGYWISAGADYIFSDATTLTGSIGVFGTIPDFSKTLKDVAHINVTSVPSNKHSDMFGGMRPLSGEEIAYVQKDIESIYTAFTGLVAEGRKMDVERVDEIGQGRVWTGRDALGIGLVDSIGGIVNALDYAAALVNLPEYRLVEYPKPLTVFEQIMDQFMPLEDNYLVKLFSEMKEAGQTKVFARLPYEMEIR